MRGNISFIAVSYTHLDVYKRQVEGIRYLVDTRRPEDAARYLKSDSFPAEVILCTEAYKNENPEIVQAFVNATCKGLDWLQNHTSQEAAEVLAELFLSLIHISGRRGSWSVGVLGASSPEGWSRMAASPFGPTAMG